MTSLLDSPEKRWTSVGRDISGNERRVVDAVGREVAPGESCEKPDQVCDSEHYCNGENCVVFKKTTGVCEGDYQCQPSDRCVFEADADTGACTARVEVHEACSADEDCQSHYCVRESGATEGECASMIRLSHSEPLCDDLQ